MPALVTSPSASTVQAPAPIASQSRDSFTLWQVQTRRSARGAGAERGARTERLQRVLGEGVAAIEDLHQAGGRLRVADEEGAHQLPLADDHLAVGAPPGLDDLDDLVALQLGLDPPHRGDIEPATLSRV